MPAVEVDAQAQLADDATLRWLDGELARVDAEARSVDIDEEGL